MDMKAFLLVLVLVYFGLACFAFLAADRMIFLPPRSSYAPGELPVTLVPGPDGSRIATLHLPNPQAELTILFSHGNAEDLGYLAPWLERYRQVGFAVIAYDYRGYGLSTGGPPTAKKASEDVRAVYRYAVEELGIPPERLVALGRSVGSGPATELAASEPLGGLVIESGFISTFRVVTRWAVLPFDRFPNLRHIRHVDCPVLVIHGRDDEVIPFSHGLKLYAAAPEPKRALWLDGVGHNDMLVVAGERYWQALREFGELVLRHQSG